MLESHPRSTGPETLAIGFNNFCFITFQTVLINAKFENYLSKLSNLVYYMTNREEKKGNESFF